MKRSLETKLEFSIDSGDVFHLGDHRLACGDAKDTVLVDRLLANQSVHLLLTDPPYAVALGEKFDEADGLSAHRAILNDHLQSDEEYALFTRDWLMAVKSHLERKNGAYIFNSDKMIFSLREGMVRAGFRFTQMLIWVKTHSVIGRMDYLPQHELIAYGWCGTHAFHRSKDKSVLIYPKPNKSLLHPTMKPIGLLRNLILNSSRINDVVYDPFGGSGSTLIACEQTKRRCFMVEMDLEYCQTIIARWQKLTGLKAQKAE